MKILIISSEFPPFAGGAGVYAYYLSKGLCSLGNEVTIVTRDYEDNRQRDFDKELPDSIKVIRLKFIKLFFLLIWKKKILKIINKNHYDFIIINNNVAHLILSNIKKDIKSKYIVVHHGKLSGYEMKKKYKPLFWNYTNKKIRKLYRDAHVNIMVSDFLRKYVEDKYDVKNSVVIHNCIDTDNFKYDEEERIIYRDRYNIKENDVVFISAGRLVASKGMTDLINNFFVLAAKNENVKLFIVGEGKERGELESLCCSLHLNNRVVFTGKVPLPELRKLFNMADIFILLSRNESFGLVFLEANGCRLPVIGTRIDGIPEAVEESVSGMLVNAGDESNVQDVMSLLADNKELRKVLGENGMNRVRTYYTTRILGENFLKICR